jgi:hypothetical protein
MNKMILPAAVAAICAMGAVNNEANAADKGKNQSLGDLSCLENQIAEFDGDLWTCINTPSGGGSAPQYEFVDGNGAVLGDVLFIEDRFHAFGYFDYLSTNSVIEVIATTSKSGEPINGYEFFGNFIRKGVSYADNLCQTTGYTNGGTREIGMLDFLQSDSFIYWANMDSTTFTELVLSEVPAPSGAQDWYSKSYSDSTCTFRFNADISSWAVQIESYGAELDAPVPPIQVVEKP